MPLRMRRKEFRGQLKRPDYAGILLQQKQDGYFRDPGKKAALSRSVRFCRQVFILVSSLVLLGGIVFVLF